MSTTLTERRALVTGGSRGIGAEIVRRLTADGAAVAFTYSASKAEVDEFSQEQYDRLVAVNIGGAF